MHAFQNGAAFPDWGYQCVLTASNPQLAEWSEAAHWWPFQQAVLQQILGKYGLPPWNASTVDAAERLVAFLLGVAAHAASDVVWHNLGVFGDRVGRGFIQALALAENRTYADAHTLADVGGELVAAHDFDLSAIVLNPAHSNKEFLLLAPDLAQVYAALGWRNQSAAEIEWTLWVCMEELQFELEAVRSAAAQRVELLYDYYATESPFLVERFEDWWAGGLHSLASWSAQCWLPLDAAIFHTDRVQPCLLLSGRNKYSSRSNSKAAPDNEHPSFSFSFPSSVSIESSSPPSVSKSVRSSCLVVGANLSDNGSTTAGSDRNSIGSRFWNRSEAYAGFGAAMAFLTPLPPQWNTKILDTYLAIGTPGLGLVEILNVTVGADEDGVVVAVLSGGADAIQGSRFGHALAVLDVNLDGVQDLVVGEPLWGGVPDLAYRGRVSIFFGGAIGGLNFGSTTKRNKRSLPDLVIEGGSNQDRNNNNSSNSTTGGRILLGWSFSVGDVDGDRNPDLLLNVPFFCARNDCSSTENGATGGGDGAVGVLFSSKSLHPAASTNRKTKTKTKTLLFPSEDVPLLTENNAQRAAQLGGMSFFGWSSVVLPEVPTNKNSGPGALAVSEPLSSCISLFLLPLKRTPEQQAMQGPLLGNFTETIYGTARSLFGSKLAWGLGVFDTCLTMGDQNDDDDDEGYDGNENNENKMLMPLAIGAPYDSDDRGEIEPLYLKLRQDQKQKQGGLLPGGVYLATLFLNGTVQKCALASRGPDAPFARFGVTNVRTAPRFHEGDAWGYADFLEAQTLLHRGGVEPLEGIMSKTCAVSSVAQSRFGESVVSWLVELDGKFYLRAAVSLPAAGVRSSGAVAVIDGLSL
jgi:hypothetical protein